MLELGVKMLVSYLLGSLNGALLIGRLEGGVDIRRLGSGNAGGTNALRTMGRWFAARVMLIDVGKGFLPAWLLPGMVLPGVPLDLAVSREVVTLACAGAAVVGHCFPVWFDFKGGKGAATAVGALLALDALLGLPALAVWVVVLVATGFVGLATILAAAVLPLWVGVRTGIGPLFWFLAGLALFILYTHRENVRRLFAGTENRMAGAMLWRRLR
jgi:glycerol-3-phosphate acyltransferase PlsY